eukprot:TRINITY_DN29330_c0_g1_i1.p1 TRINITY_DN29330_c0_g1~~TRINITY_DN29330_c0_g1_i1.p1  ORF type:complete len:1490 (+),score=285.08 TRINITY_DN29330_c0_g1_i1:210-4472(+)
MENNVVLGVDVKCSETPNDSPARHVDVVLIVDTSGSMHDAIRDVQETCLQVFGELHDEDRISIVTFQSFATLALPLTAKVSANNFENIVRGIQSGGGTNIKSGLDMGLAELQVQTEGLTAADRSAYALLLSDGQDGSSTQTLTTMDSASDPTGRPVTIHALGFTAFHDIAIMSNLPQKSSGSPGSYYYLATSMDIAAAVGDCLGSMTLHRPCHNFSMSLSFETATHCEQGWYGPAGANSEDDVPLLSVQQGQKKIPSLQASERQFYLFVLPYFASSGKLELSWEDANGKTYETTVPVELGRPRENVYLFGTGESLMARASIDDIAVACHILRLQVASALVALALNSDLQDRFSHLHEAVLRCLSSLESFGADAEEESLAAEVLFLEGMLQALERDLGEALTSRAANQERKGVLLSFAAEHFAMHSTSSLSRVRTAYASKEQIQTRLRFLQSFAQDKGAAKLSCILEQNGLPQAEVVCRKELEKQVCFVMLSGWRECVLGLGLYVHPRTCRERRAGIPAEVDLVVDYLSAEAYNLGVRATVHGSMDLTDPEETTHEAPFVLQSSARRRINAWLPLYINESNWSVARTFAPSAFSLIATQLNTTFIPEDAMKVCARLMCCAVVGFVRETDEWKRAKASEKAVQMYCDVHRLFLQMAQEHPVIRQVAQQHLHDFIRSPDARVRKHTSDLGLLITYLSIIDDIDWSDLYKVFVPEMLRRAFARMQEPFSVSGCKSDQQLVDSFDALEPEHGRVILCFKIFNDLITRPSIPWAGTRADSSRKGDATDETDATHMYRRTRVSSVRDMYDACWGQLPSERRSQVLAEIARVSSTNSVSIVLRELCPCELSNADVSELLLWAAKNGHNSKAIRDWPAFPSQSQPLRAEWQERLRMHEFLEQKVSDMLQHQLPLRECFENLLSAADSAARAEPKPVQQHRFATREEASEAAACARELAEQRKASSKGNRKGRGKSKGSRGFSFNPQSRSITSDSDDFDDAQEQDDVGQNAMKDAPVQTFEMKVCFSMPLTEQDDQHDAVRSLTFTGNTPTVADFKAYIAQKYGLYQPQLRMITRSVPLSHGDSIEDTTMKDEMRLDTWNFNAPGALVEVKQKRRAGKKLKQPGNGWHASHSKGRTYPMRIASVIVHDLVFSSVQQYFTVCDHESCLQLIQNLCSLYRKDAVVLCGADPRFLESDASRFQVVTKRSADGVLQLELGKQTVSLLHEVDDEQNPMEPADAAELQLTEGEELCNTLGFAGKNTELPVPAKVDVPEGLGVDLVFVMDGNLLRETASLSKVLCKLRGSQRRQPQQVVHLATDIRRLMVSSEAELSKVSSALEGHRVTSSLEIEGQASIPNGAVFASSTAKDASGLPAFGDLPAILDFRLRQPSLGFIMRLQDRFGCRLTEIPYQALQAILRNVQEPAGSLEDSQL